MNIENVTVENCIELIQAEAQELRKNPDQITTHEIMALRLGLLVNTILKIESAAKSVEIANLKAQIEALG